MSACVELDKQTHFANFHWLISSSSIPFIHSSLLKLKTIWFNENNNDHDINWHDKSSRAVVSCDCKVRCISVDRINIWACWQIYLLSSVPNYGLNLRKSTKVWINLCLFLLFLSSTWLNEIPQLLIFRHTSERLCQQATARAQTEPDIWLIAVIWEWSLI